LSGAAIHALVELDERSTLSMVEKRFSESKNPYELIEGARALSLWGNQQYYKVLLSKYLLDIPPQAKDELSLSVARLLGLYDSFYSDMGLWRRETSQLLREWQERFAHRDSAGLIDAVRSGKPHRELFVGSLNQQRSRFQTWFYEDTQKFFRQLPPQLHQETAFLMAFLLLSDFGLHIYFD
jgi:hypothetical protein